MANTTYEHDCSGSCSTCSAAGSCPDRIVCRCLGITEESLIFAIRTQPVRNLLELKQVTKAGDGCTCCHEQLRTYLSIYASRTAELTTV